VSNLKKQMRNQRIRISMVVQAVACERVSGIDSLETGKRTGNFAIFRGLRAKAVGIHSGRSMTYAQIPYAR
jgi:hypothetical protein